MKHRSRATTPRTRRRRSAITTGAYTDPTLSATDHQVLGYLATYYDGWIRITQGQIAGEIRRSRTGVHRALYHLMERGYIEMVARYNDPGAPFYNLYRLVSDSGRRATPDDHDDPHEDQQNDGAHPDHG